MPDKNDAGDEIAGTGGRPDFFFYLSKEDVFKFVTKRFRYNMKWWEDVYFNGVEAIYPKEFRDAFPPEGPTAH